MKFTVEIAESSDKLNRLALKAFQKKMSKIMIKASREITREVRKLIKSSIRDQPEYSSLDNGELAAHFGLKNGRQKIERIIDIWAGNFIVKQTKATVGSGLVSFKMEIKAVRSDYSDVLTEEAATVRTKKGDILPWLEWLLKFGDRVIIRDFEIDFNPISGTRSGQAYMRKKAGGTWSVPPQFSGTQRNNFVTRAFKDLDSKLENIIKKAIKNAMR